MTKNKTISCAPMMGKTDKHFIYMLSLISKNVHLYTEMMHANVILKSRIIHNYINKNINNKVAIQLAGNNPKDLSLASQIAEKEGFSEININCGCPSPKVISGSFGISLLLTPETVTNCVEEIKLRTNIPVSIKTRIGIDYDYCYEVLDNFISKLMEVGCKKFIIHARTAILNGLSTKDNLTVPKLNYNRVFQLKKKFKSAEIIINGGINNLDNKEYYFNKTDGIMIGRAAYNNPWIFYDKDESKHMPKNKLNRTSVCIEYLEYISKIMEDGNFYNKSIIHLSGLYRNMYGSKKWRQLLANSILEKSLLPLNKFLEKNYYI